MSRSIAQNSYPGTTVYKQYVYDPNTMSWVAEQQPILNAGTVTANLATTGLATETSVAAIKTNTDFYSVKLDWDGTNPIYFGKAPTGSSTSASAWQIKKLSFDIDGNLTSIQYANGSTAFNTAWDDRASLSYS